MRIEAGADLAEAWRALGADLGILEAHVDFAREISVIVARGLDGEIAAYVPVENRHGNHILDTTMAPAPIAQAARRTAPRPWPGASPRRSSWSACSRSRCS